MTVHTADADALQTSLRAHGSHFVALPSNLVDQIWDDRPARPSNPIFPLPLAYAGEPHTAKLARLRDELKARKSKALVVSMLDEVAWLFNLRGSDIEFNPVFFAYAVVTQDHATLFVNTRQVDDAVREWLGREVEIAPYDGFFRYLGGLGARLELSKDAVRGGDHFGAISTTDTWTLELEFVFWQP